MAGLGPTVTLTFAGDDSRLSRTIKSVERKTSGLAATLGKAGKGFAAFAAGGSAIQAVGGAVGAVTALSGAALVLPGALLAGGAAMGTLKLATAGFGDALKSMDDPAKFAEAIKDMAPAAQDTAKAFQAMNPELKALKQEVQGAFFAGFAEDVKKLGATYIPVLKSGMSGLATQMNGMAKSAAGMLMQPAAINDVNEVFRGTNGLLENMRFSLGHVTSGFLGLGAVGAQYLPALGTAIGEATAKFRGWVDAGVESGRVNELIDQGIQAFKDLGAIIGNIGSTLGSVFTGLGGSTESFLAPLRVMTAKLAEFAASPAAQAAFQALGEAMRAAGALLSSVLLSALHALVPVVMALAPVVTSVAATLTEWSGVLGPLAVVVLGLAGAMKLMAVGMALYSTITTAVSTATKIWAGVQWLLNAALTANPIGIVIVAVAALVAGIIYAWNNCETFRSVVMAVWEGIKSAFGAGVNFVKAALAWFGTLPGLFSGWFGAAKNVVVSHFNAVVGFVGSIPGRILGALGNLGGLLLGAGQALVNGLLNGIRGAWGRVVSFVQSGVQMIRNLLPFSPAKEGPFSGRGYVTYSGKALTTDFANSLRAGMPTVASAAQAVMDSAHGSLTGSVSVGAPRSVTAGAVGAGGGAVVTFNGNTSDAVATMIMGLIRTGKIQVAA